MLLNELKTLTLNESWKLAVLIVGLTLFAAVVNIFYNIYLHPLASYPGPKFAAASRLWYCQYALRGILPSVLLKAHERYGHVVRVAPNELSYTHSDAWNDIYGHRHSKPEVMKDPLFYQSTVTGPSSIINANRKRHGIIKKQMSRGFSEKALREQDAVIRSYSDLFLQRLREDCSTGPQDMTKWFNFFTFDVMGDLVFGQSFGCLKGSVYHPWVAIMFDSLKSGTFVRCSKYWSWLTPLAIQLVPKELMRRREAQRQMSKEKGESRKALKTDRLDLISGLLKPNSPISDQEYQSTVDVLIIAGSETTATLMSGATYCLVSNPDKLKKAVHEVRSSFSSIEEISFVSVNSLNYLLASLNETLRHYPPVADGLPRKTGANHEIICGQDVSPHTTVRVPHWPTYHHSENFTSPHEFIPERWLDENSYADDNKAALQPFHVGPRNCLGRNLAFVEMRLLMALLLWSFDLELAPESKNWSKQKAYTLWEKPPLMIKLTLRVA